MTKDKIEVHCYCGERDKPNMKKFFEDIPMGYCGFCDICGEAGHLQAHPRSPTSGVWCDTHYKELVSYKIFTLGDIIPPLFMFIIVGSFIYNIFTLLC